MKKCSTRVAALGLSTITLAGTVTFPVQAEAFDDSESLVFVPEQSVETQVVSEEQQVAAEAEAVSETVVALDSAEAIAPVEADATDNIEDIENNTADIDMSEVVTDTENIAKAEAAMNDAEAEARLAAEAATEIMAPVVDATAEAKEVAQAAEATVVDASVNQTQADAIISNAEATVEEAETKFNEAEQAYNDKLNEYEAAKDDYDKAVAAYNKNKEEASSNLATVEADLQAAEEKLSQLEAEVKEAQDAFVSSGAGALVAADADKATDISKYIATIVQYYYGPQSQLVADDQSITNVNVDGTFEDYVTISYDIMAADGTTVLRHVSADYGYEIDSTTGEISIYDNRLVYTYQNKDGQVVEISKKDAEKLSDGQIAIDSYWTATGFYIPRYSVFDHYHGYISSNGYSDAKAINQGKTYLEDKYNSYYLNYYNAKADFLRGTRTQRGNTNELNIDYDIYYDAVVSGYSFDFLLANYSYADMVDYINARGGMVISSSQEYYSGIISYIQTYEVDDYIKANHYSSYDEALAAIIGQAKRDNKAVGIDEENSNIDISEQTVYANVEKAFSKVFSSTSKEYTAYIQSLNDKLSYYNNLVSEVSSAKADYENAKKQVADLQQKIEKLDAASDINVAATLARLQGELEKAQANYDEAKDNLAAAQTALANAKATYESRFAVVPVEYSYVAAGEASLEEVVLEDLLQEEDEELEEEDEDEEDDLLSIIAPASVGGAAGNDGMAQNLPQLTIEPEVVQPEVVPEEVTIPDEETPLGITVAGLLARGKWFVGLGGVAVAGVGVGILEAKRRAAMKLLDKLNQ
ncbi:MAG: hypothetical protein J6P79_05190 [Pseudobutyrivibrio sp.]|nr:hypothetical protein [Pseudobutyrivibrio sp.]